MLAKIGAIDICGKNLPYLLACTLEKTWRIFIPPLSWEL